MSCPSKIHSAMIRVSNCHHKFYIDNQNSIPSIPSFVSLKMADFSSSLALSSRFLKLSKKMVG